MEQSSRSAFLWGRGSWTRRASCPPPNSFSSASGGVFLWCQWALQVLHRALGRVFGLGGGGYSPHWRGGGIYGSGAAQRSPLPPRVRMGGLRPLLPPPPRLEQRGSLRLADAALGTHLPPPRLSLLFPPPPPSLVFLKSANEGRLGGVSPAASLASRQPSHSLCSVHRYAASCPRPLVPFDSLYGHEVTSNGDSSPGGPASQESTMERPKPGKEQRGAGSRVAGPLAGGPGLPGPLLRQGFRPPSQHRKPWGGSERAREAWEFPQERQA